MNRFYIFKHGSIINKDYRDLRDKNHIVRMNIQVQTTVRPMIYMD
jgi:hypothetical protein